MNKTLSLLLVILFSISGFSSCTTGAKLRGQAKEIQTLNLKIHERAYNCAPKELAFAESNVEFGLYELTQGNFVQSREHLMLAERNAKAADKLSDFDACRDSKVEIAVTTTPNVELKKPEPKPEDKDGDGIRDDVDQCPLDAEDFDSFQDEDGCPDRDNDKDGIEDIADRCMFVPEDKDGFVDQDGCPDFDNDGDGIADLNDQCPNKPEDYDRFQDEDGCPDDDNDNDQISDFIDRCPNDAETYNGNEDEDGCPDKKALAQIDGDQIRLNEKVFFKTGKADILAQSYPLLIEVADILKNNKKIKIRVEGHTDSRGSDRYNLKLSDRRASSVRLFLIERGVEDFRIVSEGYGEERPIETNSTESGRASNRRVEIHITSN